MRYDDDPPGCLSVGALAIISSAFVTAIIFYGLWWAFG
jgi:hypothetical protein